MNGVNIIILCLRVRHSAQYLWGPELGRTFQRATDCPRSPYSALRLPSRHASRHAPCASRRPRAAWLRAAAAGRDARAAAAARLQLARPGRGQAAVGIGESQAELVERRGIAADGRCGRAGGGPGAKRGCSSQAGGQRACGVGGDGRRATRGFVAEGALPCAGAGAGRSGGWRRKKRATAVASAGPMIWWPAPWCEQNATSGCAQPLATVLAAEVVEEERCDARSAILAALAAALGDSASHSTVHLAAGGEGAHGQTQDWAFGSD